MSDNKTDAASTQSDNAATYPEKPAPTSFLICDLTTRRWSPRVFEEGRQVEHNKLLTALEAARWAPSCFNEQPWRFLVFDGADAEAMEKARACLVEGNAWALKAPVLLISVARETFTQNDKPNRTAQQDAGLAMENFLLEAVNLGLAAHAMAGFDVDKARSEFNVPEGYTVLSMIAVGYPYQGSLDDLSEKQRGSELSPRKRKSIGEIAFAGIWDAPYDKK